LIITPLILSIGASFLSPFYYIRRNGLSPKAPWHGPKQRAIAEQDEPRQRGRHWLVHVMQDARRMEGNACADVQRTYALACEESHGKEPASESGRYKHSSTLGADSQKWLSHSQLREQRTAAQALRDSG